MNEIGNGKTTEKSMKQKPGFLKKKKNQLN